MKGKRRFRMNPIPVKPKQNKKEMDDVSTGRINNMHETTQKLTELFQMQSLVFTIQYRKSRICRTLRRNQQGKR
jgi:hypothetical protein